jgi:hypothetical protein
MRESIVLSNKAITIKFNDDIDKKHLREKNIEEMLLLFNKIYDNDEFIRNNFKKIVKFLHPFDTINKFIGSRFTYNRTYKMTNAFMKMWEFMKYIKLETMFETEKLTMFDIAGAPGMFVLAADNYLRKIMNKELSWYSCSLSGGTALEDRYDLYKNNPERYIDCDVTNEEDLKKCIEKFPKCQIVTGDIGMFHDDDFSKLQEESHFSVQWGQMVLALNMVEIGGICFLKMYTYVYNETLLLLDILCQYFEKVEVVKPLTSRIINDESYIICYKRNDKISNVPLLRHYGEWESNNTINITEFDVNRNKHKMDAIIMITNILHKEPTILFKGLMQNIEYKAYFKQLATLNYEFMNFR